jgi:hypothetical protein
MDRTKSTDADRCEMAPACADLAQVANILNRRAYFSRSASLQRRKLCPYVAVVLQG